MPKNTNFTYQIKKYYKQNLRNGWKRKNKSFISKRNLNSGRCREEARKIRIDTKFA